VCNYGSMTGQDPIMNRADVIYRGVILTGFMLGRFLAKRSIEQVRALYAELADRVVSGDLNAPVEKIYPIEEIQAALVRAQQGERTGKILVAPNGPV
jgi:mitochondrial enoyl-[acyl-carrier protein] reductase / trans-2-enoyl-CoA reductase